MTPITYFCFSFSFFFFFSPFMKLESQNERLIMFNRAVKRRVLFISIIRMMGRGEREMAELLRIIVSIRANVSNLSLE